MTWVCKCGETGVRFFDITKRLHIHGDAFLYGQPYEHIACRSCGDRYRFIELIWTNEPVRQEKKRVVRRKS